MSPTRALLILVNVAAVGLHLWGFAGGYPTQALENGLGLTINAFAAGALIFGSPHRLRAALDPATSEEGER